MNVKSLAKRAEIVRCLVEGNSVRSTVRMTGAAKNTVVKLLADLGQACQEFHDETVRNLNSMVVQADEIWSFVGCKEKRVTPDKTADGQGDAWTWIAIDADSKLVICWHLGLRTPDDCRDFVDDLADRCAKRIQLTTDGLGHYRDAVRVAFGPNVDYGQIIKLFAADTGSEIRYSPSVCTSCKTKVVTGDPIESQISTSYVERQNLTLRMQNRRFTRLTNAFSKKLENHGYAIALHYVYYNFCRKHQTLKTTPAVAAGVTDHVWSVEELVGLISN
jgi:IS1 family transposase